MVRSICWAGTPSPTERDRKSTRLNSSHPSISYAVFCLKKKKKINKPSHAVTNLNLSGGGPEEPLRPHTAVLFPVRTGLGMVCSLIDARQQLTLSGRSPG